MQGVPGFNIPSSRPNAATSGQRDVQGNTHEDVMQALQAQSKSETATSIQDQQEVKSLLLETVKDLKEEISKEETATKTYVKEPKEEKTQALGPKNSAAIQSNAEENQTKAGLDQQPQLANQAKETNAAAALNEAALEKLKKDTKQKKGLEEKMEMLATLEADFQGLQFKDPEQQRVVQEFFENVDRFRRMKKRLKQLVFMEEEYEEKKRQKDKQSKDNGKK